MDRIRIVDNSVIRLGSVVLKMLRIIVWLLEIELEKYKAIACFC